jgi:hypothetical protein
VPDSCGIAVELLGLVAEGKDVPGGLVTQLAEAVLGQPHVALALGLLRDGPHVLRRAIELARLLVEAAERLPQPGIEGLVVDN